MPAYLFTCQCGITVERVWPVSKSHWKPRCSKCKRTMARDFVKEQSGFKHRPGTWPLLSTAAGVLPQQIEEARAQSVALGVPTDFAPKGEAIFRSKRHRKEYCEAIHMFDQDGGYGDPQRR